MPFEFITVLTRRVESLLPNKTGQSVAEVHMNPQFLASHKVILQHQRNHPNLTSFTLKAFAKALLRITDENKNISVEERTIFVISSTLILMKLLVEAIECVWDRRDSFSSDIGINHSRFSCYEIPRPIDSSIIPEVIDTLVHLFSPGVNRKALDLVRNGVTASSGSMALRSSFVPSPATEGDHQRMLLEIDGYLSHVCSFVATANPRDYFEYLNKKLFYYAEHQQYVPPSILARYMPLMRLTFYTEETAPLFGKGGADTMRYIRSNTWRQAFFVLITVAIQNQSFSRPQDYGSLTEDKSSELIRLCNTVFDVISDAFEASSLNSRCYFFAANWLLMLCVEEFSQLEQVGHSRMWTRAAPKNKRLAYLGSILKDAENGTSAECFDSLTKLFHLCSRLKFYNSTSHPVYHFCMTHLDSSYENLIRFSNNPLNTADSDLAARIDVLNIELFIAALILRPDYYVNVFLNAFERSQNNIVEVRPLVSVIRELSASESGKPIFDQLMVRLWRPLKSMIMGSVNILKLCEQSQGGSTSLSSSSIGSPRNHSEAMSQFTQDDNISLSKTRTIFERYVSKQAPVKFRIVDEVDSHARNSLCQHYLARYNHSNADLALTQLRAATLTLRGSSQFESTLHLALHAEELLVDFFKIFCAAPHLYFNDPNLAGASSWDPSRRSEILADITFSALETSLPLKYAFKTKPYSADPSSEDLYNSALFDAACSLAILLVDPTTSLSRDSSVTISNYFASNLVIEAICQACLLFSIADSKFKSCFVLINRFLLRRESFRPIIAERGAITNQESIDGMDFGISTIHAIEKVLLLSMCSHDLQLHSISKITMKWYCDQFDDASKLGGVPAENLAETFEKVVSDQSVFTGFVSLHKKLRAMLREAKPTMSLYEVWLLMYHRWANILDSKVALSDDIEMVLKHFTGFLVSISGSFMMEEFAEGDMETRQIAQSKVSDFFDRCISLITSDKLVVRVMIKEAIALESHWAVYPMVVSKLMATANLYCDNNDVSEESILYFEMTLMIFASMLGVRSNATFVIMSMLGQICPLVTKFILMVEDDAWVMRLRLRFCKMAEMIESYKGAGGIQGSYKIRNTYAKLSADWLEQAVFWEQASSDSSSIFSKTQTLLSNKEHDFYLLKIDSVLQCSRTLLMQLERNYLEVPEGTKDSDIRKNKDLAFGNYFSLFYKIIQEYTKYDAENHKSKHKLSQIMDNVLKCISNILQSDTDIGMQFVLPLGYHESVKIRSIFLGVFSNMLMSRTMKDLVQPKPEDHIMELSKLVETFGAIAEVASSSEYNLLASSMYGIFSYTGTLDALLTVLIRHEIASVLRSTSVLRRNSTLTRLLYYFTKENGDEYLQSIIKPLIEDIVEKSVDCEVEKTDSAGTDTEVYMMCLNKLVDGIIRSTRYVPNSFRFICAEIHHCVKNKFCDSAMTAVGSFLFLRFLCPAIISPETSLGISNISPKVKRTLMQLVKVVQMMANGSLSLLKWPALNPVMGELEAINEKIKRFLMKVAVVEDAEYPFIRSAVVPVPELRYLHKFIYNYSIDIRETFVTAGNLTNLDTLQERLDLCQRLDQLEVVLGQPKLTVQLQIVSPFKSQDATNAFGDQFNDFMAKMSMRYVEKYVNVQVVQNYLSQDGTPVMMVNHKRFKECDNDQEYVAYKMFETASQFWDGDFYLILDYTEFVATPEIINSFVNLLRQLAPERLFRNCARLYYFDVPKENCNLIVDNLMTEQMRAQTDIKMWTLSLEDNPEIINSLNLDPVTISIGRDTRVTFAGLTLYDSSTDSFLPATLKLGRKWMRFCWDERIVLKCRAFVDDDFAPIDIYRLCDIVKCEVSSSTKREDEFTIHLKSGKELTIRSPERLEILRFLYFTTSRLSNTTVYEDFDSMAGDSKHHMHWFCRLYNLVFQGLLSDSEEVRSAAESLFGSLSTFYGVELGTKASTAMSASFPANTTAFVVLVSEYLAKNFPQMTFRFFKAYLDNVGVVPNSNKLSSIVFMAPWMENIYDFIFMDETVNGPQRVAVLVRQLCRLSASNRDYISFFNDYIWKKLYAEARLIPILVDEVVAFATDNKNDSTDWTFVISIIFPSVETCGEVVNRLIACVNNTRKNDLTIPYESKLFEIKLLVKICASLFFNSYSLSRLFLADILFITSLFIDNRHLDFGTDLQKLFVSVVQSFLHKPDLTEAQTRVIEDTVEHCVDQRGKMLFGLTRGYGNQRIETGQLMNTANNLESMCDNLELFIQSLGVADDSATWRLRWLSNVYEVALSPTSIFHRRAIMIVGILAKLNIAESTACKILCMESKIEGIDMETCNTVSFANARMMKGLPISSHLPPAMLWPYLCYSHVGHVALFQAVLGCILAILLREFLTPRFKERVLESSLHLKPFIQDFEQTYKFRFTADNFEFHVFYAFTQGLKVSQFKHGALLNLMQYYEARMRHDRATSDIALLPKPDQFYYLVFIYLNTEDAAFAQYAAKLGMEERLSSSGGERGTIPQCIVEYLASNTAFSNLTLIHACNLYALPLIDTMFRKRLLEVANRLYEVNKQVGLLIFNLLKHSLEQDLATSNNVDIESISRILLKLLESSTSSEKYVKLADKILSDNDVVMIQNCTLEGVADDLNTAEKLIQGQLLADIHRLQAMFYRSANLNLSQFQLE